MSPADRFKSNLDKFLFAMVGAFLIAFAGATVQWYRMSSEQLETLLFPVFHYVSMDDWQETASGQWVAVVTVEKYRSECVYVKGQIPTVLGLLPSGEIKESTVSFVGDFTPGSNRNVGIQILDKGFQIDDPTFIPGTKFWGTALHRCHEGDLTVTNFGPFIVGQNGPAI